MNFVGEPDPELFELRPDARVVPRRSPKDANSRIPSDLWEPGGRIRSQSSQNDRSPVEAEVEALPLNVFRHGSTCRRAYQHLLDSYKTRSGKRNLPPACDLFTGPWPFGPDEVVDGRTWRMLTKGRRGISIAPVVDRMENVDAALRSTLRLLMCSPCRCTLDCDHNRPLDEGGGKTDSEVSATRRGETSSMG